MLVVAYIKVRTSQDHSDSMQRMPHTNTYQSRWRRLIYCRIQRSKESLERKNGDIWNLFPNFTNHSKQLLSVKSWILKCVNYVYPLCTQVGTFLIRFSDSELGGVTVAWISSEQNLIITDHIKRKNFNDNRSDQKKKFQW